MAALAGCDPSLVSPQHRDQTRHCQSPGVHQFASLQTVSPSADASPTRVVTMVPDWSSSSAGSATLFVPPPAVAQPCGLTALSPSLAKGHCGGGQDCPIWMPMDTGLTDSPEQGGEGTLPKGSHPRHPCARERPWCLGLGCQTHMQSRRELQGQAMLPHRAGPPDPEATCW